MSDIQTTKTVYALLIHRFSNVSNDLSTFVMTFDSKEKAEEYMQKQLSETEYDCLRFAVTLVPITMICPDTRFLHYSITPGYIDAKLGVNLSKIKPITPNDQDQK